MNLKALALVAGMACAALPAFAKDRVLDLSASKASIASTQAGLSGGGDSTTFVKQTDAKGAIADDLSATSIAEPQIYVLMLAGLGVVALLLSRRRLH
jgi:hypothetical protein